MTEERRKEIIDEATAMLNERLGVRNYQSLTVGEALEIVLAMVEAVMDAKGGKV